MLKTQQHTHGPRKGYKMALNEQTIMAPMHGYTEIPSMEAASKCGKMKRRRQCRMSSYVDKVRFSPSSIDLPRRIPASLSQQQEALI